MNEENPYDRSSILFLALTRPILTRGVPVEGFAINVVGTLFAGMLFQSPTTIWRSPVVIWSLGIPIHMILQRLTAYDYHWPRTLRFWLEQTIGPIMDCLPERRQVTARDIPTSV